MSIIDTLKEKLRKIRSLTKSEKSEIKKVLTHKSTLNSKLWEKIFKANAINLNEKELIELAGKISYNANKDTLVANVPLKYLERPDNYSFGVNTIINKQDNTVTKIELGKLEYVDNVIDLAHEIQRLNPKTEIELERQPNGEYKIQSNKLPEELKLPENFYFNFKNGITNKHQSPTGIYIANDIDLKPLKEIKNNYDIFYELRRLNPTVPIGFGCPNFTDQPYDKKLYYQYGISVDQCELIMPDNIDMSKLNYPEGFYYNEKNGVTNKHNSKDITYKCLDVYKNKQHSTVNQDNTSNEQNISSSNTEKQM